MKVRALQFFFVAFALAAPASGDGIQPGTIRRCASNDVDGNQISSFDGHVTLLAVVTRANQDDARVLADRVPRQYYGDPHVRLVTVVNFQGKIYRSLRAITSAVIRRRLEAEAQRLRPIYEGKRLAHDPRRDLFVIADFDAEMTAGLGLPRDRQDTTVLVLNGEGRLVEGWNGVPSAGALSAALSAADERRGHQ